MVEPQVPIARIPDMHITGQAAYRERIALQPGALFEAVLADVSRADASANVIARTSRTLGGEQVPLPFELSVKQHLIKTNLRYAVRVTITGSDGRLAWTTDTAYPIDPSLNRQDLGTLLMVRAAR